MAKADLYKLSNPHRYIPPPGKKRPYWVLIGTQAENRSIVVGARSLGEALGKATQRCRPEQLVLEIVLNGKTLYEFPWGVIPNKGE